MEEMTTTRRNKKGKTANGNINLYVVSLCSFLLRTIDELAANVMSNNRNSQKVVMIGMEHSMLGMLFRLWPSSPHLDDTTQTTTQQEQHWLKPVKNSRHFFVFIWG